MKITKKQFAKYVSDIRRVTPSTNHGRKVIILSEYTKQGQRILALGSGNEGTQLSDIYCKWSDKKQDAFDKCYQMYVNDEDSTAFSICSHTGFFFTVSWLNSMGLVFLTHKTEYVVMINE